MLEPIQGEAGVWPASDQFLLDLRTLTKEHGLLLIVDEIQPASAVPASSSTTNIRVSRPTS